MSPRKLRRHSVLSTQRWQNLYKPFLKAILSEYFNFESAINSFFIDFLFSETSALEMNSAKTAREMLRMQPRPYYKDFPRASPTTDCMLSIQAPKLTADFFDPTWKTFSMMSEFGNLIPRKKQEHLWNKKKQFVRAEVVKLAKSAGVEPQFSLQKQQSHGLRSLFPMDFSSTKLTMSCCCLVPVVLTVLVLGTVPATLPVRCLDWNLHTNQTQF